MCKKKDNFMLTDNIRIAKGKDIDEIFPLIQLVGSQTKSEWFDYSTEYEYYKDAVDHNPCFVATDNGKIVASFTSYIQEEIHPHGMYEALGITDGHGIMSLEDCVVLPEYRGHRLEAVLGQKILDFVKQNNPDIHTAYVTVHPDNIASVKNLKRIGFIVCKEALLYGGNRRYIMKKDIKD